MATTKWIKTLSNDFLGDYPSIEGQQPIPHAFRLSGNGKVMYVAIAGSALARFECSEDNIWTRENFIGVPYYNIIGTKYLPNPDFVRPVATSEDGNILVLTFTADPRHGEMGRRKIIVVSYVNGQFVQTGDITFTRQSNYNSEPLNQTNYYIQRVFISKDGLKIVMVTHGGINTLVFSNGSWNLLPASEAILPSYFPFNEWGACGALSNMSKNGMYLTLLNPSANSMVVLKFDNQINNWVLFGTISHPSLMSMYQIYITSPHVSNTGVVLAMNAGDFKLCRFEYNTSTNNYEAMNQYVGLVPIYGHPCFVSDDFNTFLCRSIDTTWPPSGIPRQYIQMVKWTNGNWVKVDLPGDIIPFMTTDPNNNALVLGMSSDATTFVSTPILRSTNDMIDVYYNVPNPTLYLGNEVTIKDADVSFNSANVFVKAPTVALNITNKNYVDVADAEINALILANANVDTTSTTEYYDLLGQRQTVQSTLAVQIDNLYQYFFNQSRVDAVIIDPTLNILSIEGCCLWLDGADSSSVIKSGSSVSAWNDKSSGGYNFTQPNSENRPTYINNVANGNSVISFSRNNQNYLGGPNGFNLGTNSYSVFVVCNFTSNVSAGIFNIAVFGVANGRLVMVADGSEYLIGFAHSGIDYNVINIPPTSGYQIIEIIINRVEGNDSYYRNGSKIGQQTYTPDNTVSILDTNNFNMIIGGYNNHSGGINPPIGHNYLDGTVAEIAAFLNPYDMTTSTRQEIEGYLAKKWGIQSSLPNDHPFRNE
jgi:hypothetical protein